MHSCFQEPSLVLTSVNHCTLPLPPGDEGLPPPFVFVPPLLNLPLPLPEERPGSVCHGIALGGRGLNCKSPGRSCRTCVISCKLSSILHPLSCIRSLRVFQIWRSAAWLSVIDAHRSIVSGSIRCVRKPTNLWLYAFKFAKCAPPHIATATSCTARRLRTLLMPMLPLLISKLGGSSTNNVCKLASSSLGIFAWRWWASSSALETVNLYFHGTQCHCLRCSWWYTRESNLVLGIVSWFTISLG